MLYYVVNKFTDFFRPQKLCIDEVMVLESHHIMFFKFSSPKIQVVTSFQYDDMILKY